MKQNLLALVLEQGFKINIMKVTIPFVLMMVLVLQTSFVRAQISSELEPVSLAVVDFRGVLSKSEAARNIRSVVDEKRQELRKYFLEVENSLRDEQKDLSKKRSIVTAEAFEKRARKLKEKAQSAQKLAQTSNQKLKKSFDQAMDKVQKELLRTVAEVAEESGVGVVLFRSAIVIAVKKLDISKEVLKRLNKKLPDVKVRFETIKGSK
jgi:outer membrane protein|tara:strand:+ start:242 stop:865 length:624 start_codon:yes stop_codon:yes gene_type:complete